MSECTERFELLKSVVAVAAADGVITRGELGLIFAIAAKIGIGRRSLNVLIERARQHQRMHEELGRYSVADAEAAMELLIGAAGIDGEVVAAEREQLVIIAGKLEIREDRFESLCIRGLDRVDQLRARRGDSA